MEGLCLYHLGVTTILKEKCYILMIWLVFVVCEIRLNFYFFDMEVEDGILLNNS